MMATRACSATIPPRQLGTSLVLPDPVLPAWRCDVAARRPLGDVAAVVTAADADPCDGVVRRLSRTAEVFADGGDRQHPATRREQPTVLGARRARVQHPDTGQLLRRVDSGDLVSGVRR